jgi:hypothetical protein
MGSVHEGRQNADRFYGILRTASPKAVKVKVTKAVA